MKKKILSAALAIVMVLSMFTFAAVAETNTTTVTYDSSVTLYGFGNVNNAINLNNWDANEDNVKSVPEFGILRAVLLWPVYGWELTHGGYKGYGEYVDVTGLTCPYVDVNSAEAFDNVARTLVFPKIGNMTNVTILEYMNGDFGAAAYVFDSGKKLAYDLWNANVKYPVTYNDAGYTYTNANAQVAYTAASYQTAVDALNSYLTYANDNQVVNVATEGRWTAQKERFAALETAINNLEANPDAVQPVDLTGYTSADTITQMLIDYYNNVDVYEFQVLPENVAFGTALKEAVDAGKTVNDVDVMVDGVQLVAYFENTWRYAVGIQNGARNRADAVWNDTTLWPGHEVITDYDQGYYVPSQYRAAYDKWAAIRDTMKGTDVKLSQIIAACNELKDMISALERANLPYTPEQYKAMQNLAKFMPAYNERASRVTMEENRAKPEFVAYMALCDEANGYLALDWSETTKLTAEAFPSDTRMLEILAMEAAGGLIESAWYDMRLAVGLERYGFVNISNIAMDEWTQSGLYTEESLAAADKVRQDYLEAYETMDWVALTDREIRDIVDEMKAELVEKPQIPAGYYDVTEFKANGTAPTADGKVFGGWYTDDTCTTPYTETTGTAYAKFVDANVLRTAFQIAGGTTADSAKTSMRFVTTVDSLDYKEVGFKVVVGSKTVTYTTSTVLNTIYANGATLSYRPAMFSSESLAFLTATLVNIPNSGFGMNISVTPYWVTADGTTVEGATTVKTVSSMIK